MNVTAILEYLRQHQHHNGSFIGYSSPQLVPFIEQREQPTIFITALILECLHDVYGTDDIKQAAAAYLKQQVNERGAWNYWDVNSEALQREPYPDDLDDTACAAAALMRHDSEWFGAHRLGQFARLLVSAEHAVGGPYNTWLIDTEQSPQWKHCDVAVNANIGYALSLQSAVPSGLKSYVESAIRAGQFDSDYYVGELPVLYFLARWYDGNKRVALKEKVDQLLARNVPADSLGQALLLSAAARLGVNHDALQPLAESLQTNIEGDHWPGVALYIDPVYSGRQHYGGAAALTTAFALEALTAYAQPSKSTGRPPRVKRTAASVARLNRDSSQLPDAQLARRYRSQARRILQSPGGEQIVAAANLVAQAVTWKIPSTVVDSLNVGSLNGWIAYTAYDNILDGNGEPNQINVANIAHRHSYENFLLAHGYDGDFADYVRSVFNTIDSANDWEQREARAVVSGDNIKLKKLPSYDDYHQLADRSLGHGLAALGIFYVQFGSMQHKQISYLQIFFKHYLIARQLNDDAHDWEEDIRAGRLSAVTSLLLTNTKPGRYNLDTMIEKWRQEFWQTTIDTVAALIRHHITMARAELAKLEVEPATFEAWLHNLEEGTSLALRGRDDALTFMNAYEQGCTG